MEETQMESKPEVEETTESVAPQAESNQDTSELGADESNNTEVEASVSDEIDYKAELEKVQNSLKKAEHTIVRQKKELKTESDVVIDEEDIAERIARQAQEKITNSLSAFRQDDLNDFINDEITKETQSLDEAKLVRLIYDERFNQKPTTKKGIRELIADAKLLANKKRFVQENRELKESLASKNSISNAGVGESVKTPKASPEDQPTEADKRAAKIAFRGDVEKYMKYKKKNMWQQH